MREEGGCLTKQSSRRLKFRSMRLHPTIVRVVIDMQLKIFFKFYSKIKRCGITMRQLKRQAIVCRSYMVSHLEIMCYCIKLSLKRHKCVCPYVVVHPALPKRDILELRQNDTIFHKDSADI